MIEKHSFRRCYLRKETKAIKEILKSKYSTDKFMLQYKEPSNYVDSSDKIIVTCDKDICTDDVIELLQKFTSGIKIYKQGNIMSAWKLVEGKIYSVDDTKTYIEVDMLEFIEVRSSKKSFELLRKMNRLKRQ